MVAYTTTYSFAKPTVGDDEDVWGGYLNGNFDTLESLLKGTTALTAINVTGNITVGGNVDGRDIAADGTKLDGIESGATADQTKADIDALNIDADTVDSLHASSFLRSDQSDTMTGDLTVSENLKADGGNLIIGDDAYSTSTSYVGMKTSFMSNTTDYMIISGTNDGNTYVSAKSGSDVHIRGGGNNSVYSLTVYPDQWPTVGNSAHSIWHSGNDGSGSGLDADLLDGYHASESSTGSTLAARNSSGDLYMRYGISAYLSMSHTTYQRDSDTTFYSSGDNYIRKNNATGFKNSLGLGTGDSPSFAGLNINGNLNAADNIYIAGSLYHEGDTDTFLSFGTNSVAIGAGGSQEITVTPTGVQLGDTGNGYFQPVSGNYGSIQIDGGAHTGWEGYSIGGRAVFMHNNSTTTGIYNDVDNEWLLNCTHNGETYLYYNGTYKFNTNSTGANIQGDLNAVDNIYVADNIYHEGDTDTRINFGTNHINFYAGGTETLEVWNTGTYNYNVYYEDYDALSGTSVTVNCDTAQAFSLTMTGNTTFTFNSVSSAWSTGFVLELTGNGSTVTWPTSVDWAGGTAPDAPASGETDIYVFWTRNGGTTWYGVLSVDAAA